MIVHSLPFSFHFIPRKVKSLVRPWRIVKYCFDVFLLYRKILNVEGTDRTIQYNYNKKDLHIVSSHFLSKKDCSSYILYRSHRPTPPEWVLSVCTLYCFSSPFLGNESFPKIFVIGFCIITIGVILSNFIFCERSTSRHFNFIALVKLHHIFQSEQVFYTCFG